MIKVKICGITNLRDALASINAGCDAIGFVFFKKSPRYIKPERARRIIIKMPKLTAKIGVFANQNEQEIKKIAKSCKLNILQFHGDESSEFCSRFKKYRIIKVFRIKNKNDLKNLFKYKVFAYLFDTFQKSKIGGTGKKFNWNLVKGISRFGRPVFLSGGLTSKNVNKAIKIVNPDWVDASSSLEQSPGKKDHLKVENFIKEVKQKEK